MPEVHRQILNYYRRDIHASDTIISADHPDAKQPEPLAEIEAPSVDTSPIKRFVGRFTLGTAKTEREEP